MAAQEKPTPLRPQPRPSLLGMCGVLASLAFGIGITSCSLVLDFEETQCTSDSECTSRGSEFANTECIAGYCAETPECTKNSECTDGECVEGKCSGRWDCLEEEIPDATQKTVELEVTVSVLFGGPLANGPVTLCLTADPDCAQPVQTLTTDEDGLLKFEIDPTMRVYLEFKDLPDIFPQMAFLPADLQKDTVLGDITLEPVIAIQGLASAVGAAADPERGHLLFQVKSCLGAAPNVTFSSTKADDETVTFFVNESVPASDLDSTGDEGSGGFLNFPPGNANISIETDEGTKIETLGVIVRPGTITTVDYSPPSLLAGAAQ